MRGIKTARLTLAVVAASFVIAGVALAATGDLSFQACIEDEDSGTEGASCADAPGLDGASGVAVSGDGSSVYVASQYPGATGGAITHFSRNTSTGALTFEDCIEDEDINSEGASCAHAPGLNSVTAITISADGTSVYAASLFDHAVVHLSRNTNTGDLTFQDCIEDEDNDLEGASCADAPGLNFADGVAVSADGTSVYATSSSDNAVVGFGRNTSTGSLTFQDCIEDEDTNNEGTSCSNKPGLEGANGIALSSDGKSAYVAAGSNRALVHFTRTPSTGALSFEECIEDEDNDFEGASCSNAPGLSPASNPAVSGDGKSVYVTASGDAAITNFSRDTSTGALTFQQCVQDEDTGGEGPSCANAPGLEGAFAATVSGDGLSTYVASQAGSAIVQFNRNTSTGALGFQNCIEDEDSNSEGASCPNAPGLEGARRTALSADGTSLYVTGTMDDAVGQFSRELPPAPPEPTPSPPEGGGSSDTTPPDTSITDGPKSKTKKKKATFEFSSTEAGSTFECRLDHNLGFSPCTSPQDVMVALGKHTLEVRAKDAAGNVDPTPAEQSWKVKKKKK